MKNTFLFTVALLSLGCSQFRAQSGTSSREQTLASLSADTPIPKVVLGEASYTGSACPEDSVHSTLSDDGSQESILFDSFSVAADTKSSHERKSCEIVLPVSVPKGFRIAEVKFDERGAAIFDGTGLVKIKYTVGFLSQHEPFKTKKFVYRSKDSGEVDESFSFKQSINSKCSDSTLNFFMKIEASARSNDQSQVLFQLDSLDLSGNTSLRFQKHPRVAFYLERCP